MKIILEVADKNHTGIIKKISKFKETNQIRHTHGKIIVLLSEPIPYEDKGKILQISKKYKVDGVKML